MVNSDPVYRCITRAQKPEALCGPSGFLPAHWTKLLGVDVISELLLVGKPLKVQGTPSTVGFIRKRAIMLPTCYIISITHESSTVKSSESPKTGQTNRDFFQQQPFSPVNRTNSSLFWFKAGDFCFISLIKTLNEEVCTAVDLQVEMLVLWPRIFR